MGTIAVPGACAFVEEVGQNLNPGWIEMSGPMLGLLKRVNKQPSVFTPREIAPGRDYELCVSVMGALKKCGYVRAKNGKLEVTPAGRAACVGS